MKQIVGQLGITKIDTAQNGYDAYQMSLKKRYDFVICDLDMPVLNGYQCAQKIKAQYEQSFILHESHGENCPLLVACSALITPEIDRKCKEFGFHMSI